MRIRMLLADDHKMFTEALSRMLAPNYEIIGQRIESGGNSLHLRENSIQM